MKVTLQSKCITNRHNFAVKLDGFSYDVVIWTNEDGKFMDEEITFNGEELDCEGTMGEIRERIIDYIAEKWESLV